MTADAKGAVLTMLAAVVDAEPRWWQFWIWAPSPAERAIAAALLVLVAEAKVTAPVQTQTFPAE